MSFTYLLTPLHEHYDSGFGATGNAFKAAADRLREALPEQGPLFNETLPINFLYRHAIELFLKSTIVIIHRRLRLPYGEVPHDGDPQVRDGANWKPFQRVHSVLALWRYVKALFAEQKAFFDGVGKVDWTLPAELDEWIDTIEKHDPRSTFFRYPNPGDPLADSQKALTAQAAPGELLQRMIEAKPAGVTLVVHDEHDEVLRGYYYTGDALAELAETLRKCSEFWYGNHAALRSEVCGGR